MIQVIGDATKPIAEGTKIIAHIVNNVGLFGKGFAAAINEVYGSRSKFMYLGFCKDNPGNKLGQVQMTLLNPDGTLWLCNMFAQSGVRRRHNQKPIKYDALDKCLIELAEVAKQKKASVHMPKIGTGLAGGDWDLISKLIEMRLNEIDVYVYTLPDSKNG